MRLVEDHLFTGMSIHVTKDVLLTPEACKEIVTCSGGVFIEKLTAKTKSSAGLHIISCPEDFKLTHKFSQAGVPVMDKEWLIQGVLKHRLDPKLVVAK